MTESLFLITEKLLSWSWQTFTRTTCGVVLVNKRINGIIRPTFQIWNTLLSLEWKQCRHFKFCDCHLRVLSNVPHTLILQDQLVLYQTGMVCFRLLPLHLLPVFMTLLYCKTAVQTIFSSSCMKKDGDTPGFSFKWAMWGGIPENTVNCGTTCIIIIIIIIMTLLYTQCNP